MRALLALTILLAGLALLASADTLYTFNGTVAGYPVNASADFVAGNGTVAITLTNLLANPINVGQVVGAFSFDVSGFNIPAGATLKSSSGQSITVNADGSYSLGATGPTGWTAGWDFISGTILLCDICASPVTGGSFPAELLIGPPGGGGKYTAADSTIAGSGVYNPFLYQTASFTISTPGVTSSSVISNVDFTVGPKFGVEAAALAGGGGTQGGGMVPEAASFLLTGGGFILVGLVGRLRRFRFFRGVEV